MRTVNMNSFAFMEGQTCFHCKKPIKEKRHSVQGIGNDMHHFHNACFAEGKDKFLVEDDYENTVSPKRKA